MVKTENLKICARSVPLDKAIFGWIPDFLLRCVFIPTLLPLIRSPRTYSRHGTAARAMRSDQIRSATRGGETVDQVPSGDPIPLWGVPWSNARCAIDSLPRHASQGIVSPRSYSPSHAPDALHVWALRICTAGQQTHVGDWVLWWRWWCGQTNHVLLR